MTVTPQQQAQQQAETARKAQGLVNLSTIFGWGGLGFLFVLAPTIGIGLHTGTGALAIAGIGAISAFVGAIVGQVGRGMQGRVL